MHVVWMLYRSFGFEARFRFGDYDIRRRLFDDADDGIPCHPLIVTVVPTIVVNEMLHYAVLDIHLQQLYKQQVAILLFTFVSHW